MDITQEVLLFFSFAVLLLSAFILFHGRRSVPARYEITLVLHDTEWKSISQVRRDIYERMKKERSISVVRSNMLMLKQEELVERKIYHLKGRPIPTEMFRLTKKGVKKQQEILETFLREKVKLA